MYVFVLFALFLGNSSVLGCIPSDFPEPEEPNKCILDRPQKNQARLYIDDSLVPPGITNNLNSKYEECPCEPFGNYRFYTVGNNKPASMNFTCIQEDHLFCTCLNNKACYELVGGTIKEIPHIKLDGKCDTNNPENCYFEARLFHVEGHDRSSINKTSVLQVNSIACGRCPLRTPSLGPVSVTECNEL
ncbi:hypothetical protein L596_023157 [Steinernema carpocapsae]|uniref:Uncharacterized protein n=1 Tax=Steinernema carpocapsae TaxID=34508 RepID=A0A4V5ZZH3_STECR|nr:hypothetical protein L596_023157 [Steinernema carpocapsae]